VSLELLVSGAATFAALLVVYGLAAPVRLRSWSSRPTDLVLIG
jgi:hypothetical protein